MDGWMHGWMHGWMDGCMGGCHCSSVPSSYIQIVDTCPTEQSDHQFIISCEEDSNVYQHAISEGVSVCTNEIILTGVLRQLIEIET